MIVLDNHYLNESLFVVPLKKETNTEMGFAHQKFWDP